MSDIVHPPGTFCWAELATTDCAGAKAFYSQLMGWETQDDPIPGGGVYTLLRLGGGNVGALYELSPEMKAQGAQAGWLPYITVVDAGASTASAEDLGARIVKGAFDVLHVGTMAVIQDPTGAVFAVWQPRKHHGSDHTDGKPGSVCWNELLTDDQDRAGHFYGELFGWAPTVKEIGGRRYTVFLSGDAPTAGMDRIPPWAGDTSSHWMINFAVAECEVSAAKAKALGGTVRVPMTEIPPVGKYTVIQDPQGTVFNLVQLEYR